MEREEKIRHLVDRLGVTYEEAAQALDEAGGDLLEAALRLERAKPAGERTVHTHSTAASAPEAGVDDGEGKTPPPAADRVTEILMALVTGLMTHPILNGVRLERKGNPVTTIPGVILLALLVVRFWVLPVLFAIWLFIGLHFQWVGPQWDNPHLNDAWAILEDKAAGLRESMKGGQRHG